MSAGSGRTGGRTAGTIASSGGTKVSVKAGTGFCRPGPGNAHWQWPDCHQC